MKIETTIKDVPVNTDFYVYYHAELPLSYDTFPCYKNANGTIQCNEFNPDSLTDNEPCIYYKD